MSITDPLIGKRLGDYLIEGVLGTGGMARVYRGYDDNLDRYAAIKVIEPQLIASAEEDEYRERFLREARAIARLNHPRIVGVYQFNQIGNLYYIAMEYIEGRNLRDVLKTYLRQDKLMPTGDMLKVLLDIGDALDYAHKQSIIHRDVKPSNIIVTEEGNAVLTDFGLALNAVEGTIGNTFGSVHYIAPEQAISSAQAVPQSDQYSLGIVAYELLTGRVPFDDASDPVDRDVDVARQRRRTHAESLQLIGQVLARMDRRACHMFVSSVIVGDLDVDRPVVT